MRVKKLEILGFKSFANKTTIHFEPGVTAIVGPNGSGKSNVCDSIRWVLGEHNPRDVRAPRLEDVIFNGTDKRAPLSMAEVNLTISNEKGLLPISFTEVTITRRVYRSGESECCINQSPCRLKDIQELFLGTGLGGGTYAIIEQGHIDMILSSKPEERRRPFEEASGVAKYLTKKQETMRRLDETEEHLVRVADIISEARRQVGALERAANKARQYKAQWEQLKDFELRLAVDELTAGQSRSGELEHQVRQLQAQRDALEARKQSHMASLEACNASVSTMQQQVQALRTAVLECANHIEQHDTQCGLKTQWIETLQTQTQQLETDTAGLSARLTQLDEQLARANGAVSEIEGQLAAALQPAGQDGAGLSSVESTLQQAVSTLAEVNARLFAAASEASHSRNHLAQLSSQLQGLEAQSRRLQAQRSERSARRQELGQHCSASVQEHEALQALHEDLRNRASAAQRTLEAAGARRHELTGRLHQSREQLAHQRAHTSVLEDVWRRYEGFPDTVKTLMGLSIDGVIGPLVDLVQAASGYEKVVEAALGPLTDAVVVRDRQALVACRRALGAQQLEGCRFLVLEDCPAAPVSQEPQDAVAGVSGTVKQYIQTEPRYRGLVDWLLNDSWVIDDLQRLLAERSVPQARLVSPQGDRWDRRSWRFSGTRASGSSRIDRRQRWEQAQQRQQALEQDTARLATEAAQAEQEWHLCGQQQAALKEELSRVESSLHKAQLQSSQLSHEAQRLDDELQALSFEVQDLAARRLELQGALQHTQRSVDDSAAQQVTLEQSLAGAQAAKEAAEQQRQQLLIAQAQIEATLSALTQRADTLRARQQEIKTDRTHLLAQADAKRAQRHEAISRSEALAAEVQAHQQAREQLQQQRVARQAELQQAVEALAAQETARDQVVPHVLAAERELSALVRQIQEQSQQLSERTFRRTRLVERLRELYQIDETMLAAQQQAQAPSLTEDQRAVMTEQVQKLRAKLDNLGPVSLGSVEEYDELKRRLEFLQTQQQDLLQARDDLKASIAQINRTARTQFRETFERIKLEFQHYYGRLFNGGQADLILMDEEDVLECGIDIVARPPGKRLQNISLLSGGERALTAIALLFALFKVRPSPFCILDEIDAPLDEANVDRFTRVFEEFLELSQFILITHNKKTITKADSLYGVTMEEAGISKILSAKLAQTRAPATAPAAEATAAA